MRVRALVSRAWQGCRRLRNRLAPGGLILMYHRIAEGPEPWELAVTPRHFAEHLEVIRRLGRPTRLQDLTARIAERRRPYKNIVVTFDDGYADNLHAAKPLLERAGIPATVFVVSEQIGRAREFWWDELTRLWLEPGRLPAVLRIVLPDGPYEADLGEEAVYSEDAARRHARWRMAHGNDPTRRHAIFRTLWTRMQAMPERDREAALAALRSWAGDTAPARGTHRALTADELAKLAADGLIEIGGHTASHANLKALPSDAARDQIARGKREVERLLGAPVRSFAYPYGLYAADTAKLVRDSGFTAACTTWPSPVWRGSDPLMLPRMTVGDWDGDEFARRLNEWMAAA
jgi:peptidoglycan/xylan/chitin deacetylase (PgdA/CDA1 family)